MKWFKHDANAHIDAKVEMLLDRYGLEGYGLYFYCLELIAKNVEKHNLSFELEHDARIIARRLYMNVEQIQEMMTYMVELELFENDRGVITCLKMATRTDEYTQRLLQKTGVTTKSRQTPDTIGTKSELIEENRREETNKRFTPPTIQEVAAYCEERQNGVDAQNFIDHYEANGWMRGKNKIKDWKACVRTWEKNHKPQQAQEVWS